MGVCLTSQTTRSQSAANNDYVQTSNKPDSFIFVHKKDPVHSSTQAGHPRRRLSPLKGLVSKSYTQSLTQKVPEKTILNCSHWLPENFKDNSSVYFLRSYILNNGSESSVLAENPLKIHEWLLKTNKENWYRSEVTLYPSANAEKYTDHKCVVKSFSNAKSSKLSDYAKPDSCYEIRNSYIMWMLDLEYTTAWESIPFRTLTWNQQFRRLRIALRYCENYLSETLQNTADCTKLHSYVETNELLNIPVDQGGFDGVCFTKKNGVFAYISQTNFRSRSASLHQKIFQEETSDPKTLNLFNEIQYICDGLIWKQVLLDGATWRRPTTACIAEIEYYVYFTADNDLSSIFKSKWTPLTLSLRSYASLFMSLSEHKDGVEIIKRIQSLSETEEPNFQDLAHKLVSKFKCNDHVINMICGIMNMAIRLGARTLTKDEVSLFSIPCIDQFIKCTSQNDQLLLFIKMKDWTPFIPLYNNKKSVIPSAFIRLDNLMITEHNFIDDDCIIRIRSQCENAEIQTLNLRCNSETLSDLPRFLSDAFNCEGLLYILPKTLTDIQKAIDNSADVIEFLNETNGKYLKLNIIFENPLSCTKMPNHIFNPYYMILKELVILQQNFTQVAKDNLTKASEDSCPFSSLKESSENTIETIKDLMSRAENAFLHPSSLLKAYTSVTGKHISEYDSKEFFQNNSTAFLKFVNSFCYDIVYPSLKKFENDDEHISHSSSYANITDSVVTYHNNTNYSGIPFVFNYIFNTPLIAECSRVWQRNYIYTTSIISASTWLCNDLMKVDYTKSDQSDTILLTSEYVSVNSDLKRNIDFAKELMETDFYGYTIPLYGLMELEIKKCIMIPLSSFQVNHKNTFETWCLLKQESSQSSATRRNLSNTDGDDTKSLDADNLFTSFVSRLWCYEKVYSAGVSHQFGLGQTMIDKYSPNPVTINDLILYALSIPNLALEIRTHNIRFQPFKSLTNSKKIYYEVVQPLPSVTTRLLYNTNLLSVLLENIPNCKGMLLGNYDSSNITGDIKADSKESSVSSIFLPKQKDIYIQYLSFESDGNLDAVVKSLQKQIELTIKQPCQILLNHMNTKTTVNSSKYIHVFSPQVFCSIFTSLSYHYIFVLYSNKICKAQKFNIFQPAQSIEIIRRLISQSTSLNFNEVFSESYDKIAVKILYILYNEIIYEVPNGSESIVFVLRPWSLNQIRVMIKLLAQRYHIPYSALIWLLYKKLCSITVHTKFEQRVLQCLILVLICNALKKSINFCRIYSSVLDATQHENIIEALYHDKTDDRNIMELVQLVKLFLLFSMSRVNTFSLILVENIFKTMKYISRSCFNKYIKKILVRQGQDSNQYNITINCKTNIICTDHFNECLYIQSLSYLLYGNFRTSIYQDTPLLVQLKFKKTSFHNILKQFDYKLTLNPYILKLLESMSRNSSAFEYAACRLQYLFYLWNVYSKSNQLACSEMVLQYLHELLKLAFECLWLFDAWTGYQPLKEGAFDTKRTLTSSVVTLIDHSENISVELEYRNKNSYGLEIGDDPNNSYSTVENSSNNVSNSKMVDTALCLEEWTYLYENVKQILNVCNSLIQYKKTKYNSSLHPKFLTLFYIVKGLFELSFENNFSKLIENFEKALNILRQQLNSTDDFSYTFNSLFIVSMNTAQLDVNNFEPLILFVSSILVKSGYLQKDITAINKYSKIFREALLDVPICPFDIYPPLIHPIELETKYYRIFDYKATSKNPVDVNLNEFNSLRQKVVLQSKSTESLSDDKKIKIMNWYITSCRYDGLFWFKSINFPYTFFHSKFDTEKSNVNDGIPCDDTKNQVLLSIGSNVPYGSLGIGWPAYLKHNEQLYSIMPEYITENTQIVKSGIDVWWTNQFVEITALRSKDIKLIAVGEYHSLAVTNDNDVYAWGSNTYGQCGVPNINMNYEGKDTASYWASLISSGQSKTNTFKLDLSEDSPKATEKYTGMPYDKIYAYKYSSSNFRAHMKQENTKSFSETICRASRYGTMYESFYEKNLNLKYKLVQQSKQSKWQSQILIDHLPNFISLNSPKTTCLYLDWELPFFTKLNFSIYDKFDIFIPLSEYENSKPRASKILTLLPHRSDCIVIPNLVNFGNFLANLNSSSSYSLSMPISDPIKIADVVCGSNFSVLVTIEGSIYTWGSNVDGCLGTGSECEFSWQPTCLSADLITDAFFREIPTLINRFNHEESLDSMFSRSGSLEISGSTEPYKSMSTYYARRLGSAKQVSCGPLHVCMIDHDGGLWVWGRGDGGQIGLPYPTITHPENKSLTIGCTFPHRLRVFVRVIDVSADASDIFQLYIQAITRFLIDLTLPIKNEKILNYITCRPSNDQKTLIFTTTDSVLIKHSQLQIQDILESTQLHPTEILFEKVACGEAHSLAVGRPNGALQFQMLFTWGQCMYGQLGLQSVDSINEPDTIVLSNAVEKEAPQFTCKAINIYSLLNSNTNDTKNIYVMYEDDCRTTACLILNNYIDVRDNITVIQSGGCSNFVIFNSGKACVWGSNDFQILGFPDTKFREIQKPRLMSIYPKKQFKNGFFAMGASRLFLITTESEVLCIGKDLYGCSGHFVNRVPPQIFQEYQVEVTTTQSDNIWKPVELPANFELEKIASGAAHTIVLGTYKQTSHINK